MYEKNTHEFMNTHEYTWIVLLGGKGSNICLKIFFPFKAKIKENKRDALKNVYYKYFCFLMKLVAIFEESINVYGKICHIQPPFIKF